MTTELTSLQHVATALRDTLADLATATARAEHAETQARCDAESSDAAFSLLEERSAERDAAELRIHRAQQVLKRYMGYGSSAALQLRVEIGAALDGPADTPADAPVGYCRTCEGRPWSAS